MSVCLRSLSDGDLSHPCDNDDNMKLDLFLLCDWQPACDVTPVLPAGKNDLSPLNLEVFVSHVHTVWSRRMSPQTASHAFTFEKSNALFFPLHPLSSVIALLFLFSFFFFWILKRLKGQLAFTLNKMCSHCPQFASVFFFS